MSDKEARVRLTLNSGSFLGGMQQLSGDVQRISKNMETALQTPFSGGLKAAKESFGKIRGEISSIAKMGLGIGGGFEVVSAVKGALEMSGAYKNLSFQIEAATGQIIKSETIQKQVEETAKKCKRANQEVAESYNDIFVHTGNVAFAAKATDAVAVAAQAAQKPMSIFADIAAQLNKTLGITADEMPTALAAMTSLAGKGADLTELSAVLMRTGASAKVMGLEGTNGLGKLAGMFEVMVKGGVARKQATSGLNEIMGDLTDPTKMKAMQEEIQKKFHKHTKLVNSRGGIMGDAMFRIMDATGGDSSKLKGLFPSVGGAGFMSEIGKHYQEELGKGGGKASAREATERWIQDLGKSSLSAARQLQQMEENNKKVGSDMTDAMNEMEHVFAEPEMLNALKQMAHVMPKVAHGAAQLLEMVINHPLLGGGAVIGGKIALDLAGSGAQAGMKALAVGTGKQLAASFAADIAAGSVGSAIGKKVGEAFLVVAAAEAGWQIGKALADYLLNRREAETAGGERETASAVAQSGGSESDKFEALDRLRKQKAKLEKEDPSYVDSFFGGMAKLGNKVGLVSDDDYKASGSRWENQYRGVNQAIVEIEDSLSKGSDGYGKNATAVERHTVAMESATKRLERLGPPRSSNGLPKPGSNTPGTEQ